MTPARLVRDSRRSGFALSKPASCEQQDWLTILTDSQLSPDPGHRDWVTLARRSHKSPG